MSTPLQILQQYWHHQTFRGEQEKIIEAVLNKNDVVALLPTGGGKSVCFQVPAMLMDGLCLVISPLIALMKDQVENLTKKNIPAAAIYSGMSFFEINKILQSATDNNLKFLYISPERIGTKLFQQCIHQLNICLVAVDEAHCISQWGYDFRPSYLKIANIKEQLNSVPFIALTATATTVVKSDIIDKLQLKNVIVFKQSFEKSNISFSVFNVDSKINKAVEILNKVQGSSIIYCKNRNETKAIAEQLLKQNISANFYHAGLTQEERSVRQNNWIKNKSRVIVCTNAFGMGIDKPDVKTVIHFNIPDCIENYYQEAGRAGRNGSKAYAVLLYQLSDEIELDTLAEVKFPAIETIKEVYQHIANYLQIPIGIGEGNYYNFDIIDFCNNFKLDVVQVINILKYLEQEGFFAFSENIFIPAKVVFTSNKQTLNSLENRYPHLDLVMKTLLRTYEGIYENNVSINEKLIAKIARLSYDTVFSNLNTLHTLGIINYMPQKETPQLYYMLNRAPANGLFINYSTYLQRKKLYKEKIEAIKQYVHLAETCRSKFIANYFGDKNVSNCNCCDNCLNLKKNKLSLKEFDQIEKLIYRVLSNNELPLNTLLQQLSNFKKEKVLQVITFLETEKLVSTSSTGIITLNKL